MAISDCIQSHTNYLKKARKRYEVPREVDVSLLQDEQDIIADVIKDDQMNRIVNAMKSVLNDKYFTIMSLHYFSGLTVKEISESLNIPDKTIYKAIKTCIEKIQKEVNTNA